MNENGRDRRLCPSASDVPGRLFPGFLLIRQEVRAISKLAISYVVSGVQTIFFVVLHLFVRVSGECGLCGLPFLASLIFAQVSGGSFP
jgi:hypothetical protein